MTNHDERRTEIHRIINKHLLDDFRRFQTEYELSNAQLFQWYRLEQEILHKKYQTRQNELKHLFHSMINAYSIQFHDELRIIDEQLETATQSESDATVFANLFEIGLLAMKRKCEEVFVQQFREATQMIIDAALKDESTVRNKVQNLPTSLHIPFLRHRH